MWWGILFLVLFFGAAFGSHFTGRVEGVVASAVFLALSWWHGVRNLRMIDQALCDRLVRDDGESTPIGRL